MKLKVTYEVYRFGKWWKNSFTYYINIIKPFNPTLKFEEGLKKLAYENDL